MRRWRGDSTLRMSLSICRPAAFSLHQFHENIKVTGHECISGTRRTYGSQEITCYFLFLNQQRPNLKPLFCRAGREIQTITVTISTQRPFQGPGVPMSEHHNRGSPMHQNSHLSAGPGFHLSPLGLCWVEKQELLSQLRTGC